MKLRLPKPLKLALLACFTVTSLFTTIASAQSLDPANIGKIAFVGDSITERSGYRQQVWKNLLDNGYTDKTNATNATVPDMGATDFQMVGSRNSGTANSLYNGQNFMGVHEGHASWGTKDMIGETNDWTANLGNRGGGYIKNWISQTQGGTALDTAPPKVWGDRGWRNSDGTFQNKDNSSAGTYTPDTVAMMIGTNDGMANHSGQDLTTEQSVANIKSMVDMYLEANADTVFYISTVLPCNRAGKAEINEALKTATWLGENKYQNVHVFDGGVGLSNTQLTVGSSNNGLIVDGVHLTAQGELLYSNNLAKAMGTGQRTMGKARVGVSDVFFTKQSMGSLPSGGGALTMTGTHIGHKNTDGRDIFEFRANIGDTERSQFAHTWSSSTVAERTLELSVQMNGSGFNNHFAITFGNTSAANSLVLDIRNNEIWSGSTILYAGDQTGELADFRIAYIASGAGFSAGYYVWRNGMLIGDGLTGTGAGLNGFSFGQLSTLQFTYAAVGDIAWTESGAYASEWGADNATRDKVTLEKAPELVALTWNGGATGDWGIAPVENASWLGSAGFTNGSAVNFGAAVTVKLVSPDIISSSVTAAGDFFVNTNGNNATFTTISMVTGTTFKKLGEGTLQIGGGTINSHAGGVTMSNIEGGTLEIIGDTIINISGNRFDVSSSTLKVSSGTTLTIQGSAEFNLSTKNNGGTPATNSVFLITGGSTVISKVDTLFGNQPVSGRKTILMLEENSRFIYEGSTLCFGVRENTDVTIQSGAVLTSYSNLKVGHASGANCTINIFLNDGGILETVGVTEDLASSTSNVVFDGGMIRALGYSLNWVSVDSITLSNKGAIIDTNGFDVTISKALTNAAGAEGKLEVRGQGILTLSGTNTFSKGIVLAGGTLRAADAALGLAGKRDISVMGNAILQSSATGGTMVLDSLSVADNQMLTLGGVGQAQNLTVSGLTLGAGSILRLDLGASSQDQITIVTNGFLTLGAGALIQLDLSVNTGTFTLIDASASGITITGNGSTGAWNPTIDESALNRGLSATGAWNNGRYEVTVSGILSSATVTWNGGNPGGVWVAGGGGWTGQGGIVNFKNGDAVIFDATGRGGNVILKGDIAPASITVESGDYSFIGDGSVSGAGSLTVTGGSLSLGGTTQYSHTGGTFLNGGTLVMNGGTFTAVPTITFGEGTLGFATDMNVSTWTFAGSSPRQFNVQKNVTVTAGSLGDCNITLSGEGVFSMRNEARTATSTITVGAGATLHITGSSASTELAQGNLFAGSGNIEFDLTSEQISAFNANNTFSGSWILTSGVVRLNGNGVGSYAEKKADAIVMNGAILRIAGTFAQNVGFTFTKNSEIDATGALTIEGDVTGAYNLKKTGDGNLILNGLVDVSSIEFGAGTLSSSRVGGWAYAGVLNITGNLTLGMAGGTAMTFSGTSNLGNDRTLTVNSEVAFTGAVSSSGTLTILGSGKTIFGGYDGETSFSTVWIQTRHVEIARDMSIDHLRINKIRGTVPSGLSIAQGATLTVNTAIAVGYEGIMTESYLDVYGTLKVANGVQNMVFGEWNGAQSVTHIYEGGTLEALGTTLALGNGKLQESRESINSLIVEGLLRLKALNFGSNEATGTSTLTLSDGGEIRIGSGGLVNSHPASGRVAVINLNGGILGTMSSGDGGGEGWSSSLAMNLLSNTIGTSFDVGSNQGMTLSGALTGVGKLNKTGAGSLTLTGENTFSGGINLVGGSLTLSGSGTLGSGKVTLSGESRESVAILNLIAENTMSNHFEISAGKFGAMNNWNTASSGSITLAHNATQVGALSMGAQNLHISGAESGTATVTGNATFAGTTLNFTVVNNQWNVLSVQTLNVTSICTINLAVHTGSLTLGSHLLLSSTGGLTVDNLATWFRLTGLTPGVRTSSALTVLDHSLYLTVTSTGVMDLTWTNTKGNMIWLTNGTMEDTNWSSSSSPTIYVDGDNVTFTSRSAGEVTIQGAVAPESISVTSGDYTFVGAAITAGTLSLSDTGNLILKNANTSAGLASIAEGRMLTFGGAVGTWAGAIANSGTLSFDHTVDFTFTPNITGTGSLLKKGTNTLTVNLGALQSPDALTFSGGMTVETGILRLNSVVAASVNEDQQYRFGSGVLTLKTGAQVNLKLGHKQDGSPNYTFVNNWQIDGSGTIYFESGGGSDILAGTITLTSAAELRLSFNHGINSSTNGIQLTGALTGAANTKIILDNTQQSQWAGKRNLRLLADNSTFLGTIQVHNTGREDYKDSLSLLLEHENAAVKALIDLEGTETERTSYLSLNVGAATIGGLQGNEFSEVNTQFAGASVLTINDSRDATFAGKITGDHLAIRKTGTTTWTVSGDNSYKGGTTIAAGILKVESLNALGTEGLISLTGGTLEIAVENFAREITVSSGATNQLSGVNLSNYTGKITVSGGSLTLAGALGAGTIDLTGTSTLKMSTYSVGRTINASGTNTLSGTSFTGELNISAGTLTLGSALGVSTTNAVNLTGTGTLDMASFAIDRTVNTSGSNTLSGASFTGELNVNGGTLTLGSVLGTSAKGINLKVGSLDMASFAIDRTVNTSGSNTLSGASFTGELNVNGGTLTLGSVLGTSAKGINLKVGSLDMASFAIDRTVNTSGSNTLSGVSFTGELNVNGGTLTLGSSLGTSAKGINLKAGSLDMGTHALNRSLVVSGASSLSGNTNYTGNITLATGSNLTVTGLSLGNAQSLTIGTNANISAATVTGGLGLATGSHLVFDVAFGESALVTTRDYLTVTGDLGITATEGNEAFLDIHFTGALVTGQYTLMTYHNQLTDGQLNGLTLNMARGRTVVSLDQQAGGTSGYELFLNVQSTDSLRWTTSGGTWQSTADTDHTTGSPWALDSDPSSLVSDNNFHDTDAVIFGSEGSGDINLVGNVDPGSILVDGAAYTFMGDGALTGVGNLLVQESNEINKTSLTLSKANNDWSGQTTLTGGRLSLAVQNAAGTGAIHMNGGTLELLVSDAIANNALTYNGGTLAFAGNSQTYDLNFTMEAGVSTVTIDVGASNSTQLNSTGLASKNIMMTGAGSLLLDLASEHIGDVSLGGGTLQLTNTGGTFAITGDLTSANNDSILIFKAQSVTDVTRLTGTNTISTVKVDAHTLVLASAGAMGGNTLSLSNGATLKIEINQTKNNFALQLATNNNTITTGNAAIEFAGAITAAGAGTTLNLGGNLTLSGAISLNQEGDQLALLNGARLELGNASGTQALRAVSMGTDAQLRITGKLSLGGGGLTGAGSLVLGAGAELTATSSLTNAVQTSLTADATLDTGAFDVNFTQTVTSGEFSLIKTGAGILSISNGASNLVVILSAGTLDMQSTTATLRLTAQAEQDVILAHAENLNVASTTTIDGTLHIDGNIGGTITLNGGGTLDLRSGALSNTLYTGAGTVTFNKASAATWTKISLNQDSVFNYTVNKTRAALVLGTGQSVNSGFGSTLNGDFVFSGGTLQLGNSGAPTTIGAHTLLTLANGATLTITPGTNTIIDLTKLSLTARGAYTFTLVAGAQLASLNASLLTWKIDESKMNLLGTPSFSIAANGDLLFNVAIAASLIWNGEIGTNVWTTDGNVKNWNQGADTDAMSFADNDFVYFGDQGTGDIVLVDTVNVGTVQPKSMFVEGDQAHSFTGAGSIIATGKLLYTGTADLSFANDGVNEFVSGIELASAGAGKTLLAGKASLKGDLKLSSNLEIMSSALSHLTKVNGEGNILINGTGGAHLSSVKQGDYTGEVTIYQGQLTNKNALGIQKLIIAATGNVLLSGVDNAHIQSLSTTKGGVSIHGLTGSLSLGNVSLKLDMNTRTNTIINFTDGVGSLDMGTLTLDISSLLFSDYSKTYDFSITNGSFGDALLQMNAMGMYNNFILSGSNPNGFKVLDAENGTITIGGSKIYENFVLDVNNKWTPHITSNQVAEFTAAQFRTDPDNPVSELFKSVTVDGILRLTGTEEFTLNHLTGGSTGQILTEGADLVLNGSGDHPVTGAKGNVFEGVLSAASSKVTIQGDQSLLGANEMKTLDLENGATLTLGGYTKIYGEDVQNPDNTTTRVGVTLGENSTLILNPESLLEVAGSVTLGTGSCLKGEGTLSILVGGNLTVLDGATIGGSIVVNLEHSSNGDGTLDIGTTTVEIAGISGEGKVISNGSLTLNVSEEESFTGILTGTGTADQPAVTSGTIIKMGEGTQVIDATTDKNNLYNLTVEQGTLKLKGKAADYGDIIVGADAPIHRAARAMVTPESGHMVIENKLTATNMTVKHDGLLTIGSASGASSSLTLSGTATFDAGSRLEFYVGVNSTAIITAQTITGIANLDSLTINARDFWQANIDLVLFKAKNSITDIFGSDKVNLIGFDNKEIIYSDDRTTISLSARRGFNDNPYKNAMTGAGQNANAGMDLIWDANVRGPIDSDSNLAGIFNSMVFLGAGTEASNRLMAAVAGSTVTALAGSQRDDFRQQQDWIRNRTTGMGISPDYVHEDLPYVNGWIQANGGTTRVSDHGEEAGYNMDTFGGTFGFDVDMSAKTTWGFAFTANYNKLNVTGAETAKGHNDAYYANLFLRTQNKRWANTFIITGGWNDAKLDRTVAGALVNYTTHGTTSGSTLGAMYETTYDVILDENKTSIFQPLFNASISNASMDAYTEEGAGNASLQVDKTKGTYGTIALGARLLGTVGQSLFGRSSMGELRLQVAQDIGDDTNVAKVGLGGIQREVIGTKVGKTALQLGAGINIPVNDNGSIYLDVNGEFRSESTNVNANIGYRINF